MLLNSAIKSNGNQRIELLNLGQSKIVIVQFAGLMRLCSGPMTGMRASPLLTFELHSEHSVRA